MGQLAGRDRIGSAGELLATGLGAASGAAASSALAAAAGATTFLGSSSLGTLVGGVLVTATPVGWIAGCVLAGGAGALALAKLIRSGGRQDEIRRNITEELKAKGVATDKIPPDAETPEFEARLARAVAGGLIERAQAERLQALVQSGNLSPARACGILDRVLREEK